MNKKNILYCLIAVLLIITVAVTSNLKHLNNQTTQSSSIDIANNSDEVIKPENIKTENNEKSGNDEFDEVEEITLESYNQTQFNRALMYQDKNWAKDETINEEAWIAAQKSESSSKQTEKIVENNAEPTINLEEEIQDSKDNSAMIE